VLQLAAEYGDPFVFMARINFYRAVYGNTLWPINSNPKGKKSHHWGKRKMSDDLDEAEPTSD
jgi:hypothetical protein